MKPTWKIHKFLILYSAIVIFFLSTFCSLTIWANKTEIYIGEAKDKNGQLKYTEHHTVQLDENGSALTATTEYKDSAETIIGTMNSDFTSSLTAPNYTFIDKRTEQIHGIRRKDGDIILFKQDKGKDEKNKIFKNKYSSDTLIIGCQGLHYYLRENFSEVIAKKNIPIKFLIPGDLDYYTFNMKIKSQTENMVSWVITISNFFLKLFAPTLNIEYDKVSKRLLKYDGISNLTDENGNIQVVTITYK